jgi:hypothetical protein
VTSEDSSKAQEPREKRAELGFELLR